MTYKENSNTELKNSGIPCSMTPTTTARNYLSISYYSDFSQNPEDVNMVRNATEMAGNLILLTDKYPLPRYMEAGYNIVVRNGDYIYYSHDTVENIDAKEVWVTEHCISTGEEIYMYVNSDPTSFYGVHVTDMCFLESRKILVKESQQYTHLSKWDVIDFEENTKTLLWSMEDPEYIDGEVRIFSPDYIYSRVDNNGDIQLYGVGFVEIDWGSPTYEYQDGIVIWHKNYTQSPNDTNWEYSYQLIDRQPDWYEYLYSSTTAQFVNNKLVLVSSFEVQSALIYEDSRTIYNGIICWSYDLITNILSKSGITTNFISDFSTPTVNGCVPDEQSGKIYFVLEREEIDSIYQYYLYEFNPTTLILTLKYTSIKNDKGIYTYSTKNNAYYHSLDTNNFCKASNLIPIGNFELWYGGNSSYTHSFTCTRLDEVGPSIWYMDEQGNVCNRTILGELKRTISTPIVPGEAFAVILHFGDCLYIQNVNNIYTDAQTYLLTATIDIPFEPIPERFSYIWTTGSYVSFNFEFSDLTQEMTVRWGDTDEPESSTTYLQHTYSSAAQRLITFVCPDLTKLTVFKANNNSIIGYVAGAYVTGSLSPLSFCTSLTVFEEYDNNLSGFEADKDGASFTTQKNLSIINVKNNKFTVSFINNLLKDCVTSLSIPGRVPCTVDLTGPNMAAPSAEGLGYKTTLISAGWNVKTN